MSENETAAEQSTAGQGTAVVEVDHAGHPPAAKPLYELFDQAEIAQFDADDVQAGKALGKMLSLFFVYTILAMMVVIYWVVLATLD